ncbi:MAG: histidine phosphatase family protein [Bdellovibrionaceae bacterium]|nr:histidine phosphatase family protein [Pseudobdellovibrionaceae bacterium]
MELVLIRHATAEDRAEFARKNREDYLRPLVPKGRKRMEEVCKELFRLIPEVKLIVTSPFVRARQTAEIVQKTFKGSQILEAAELVPHAPPTAFLRWLVAHGRNHDRIFAVGHEPQLSIFASYLLTGTQESFLDLKKSGVLILEVESFVDLKPGNVELKALIPPRVWVD